MSSSAATFPARFAELVYLLANQPDASAEQAHALDAAVGAVADRPASLTTSQLNVDLLDVGQTMVGVHLHELVMRMSAHSAHQIDFLAATPRSEILGVAEILASEARPNDDGAAFDDKLVRLGPTLVEVHLGRNGFVRTGSLTPPASPHVGDVRGSTPFRTVPAFGGPTPPRSVHAIPTPPTPNESIRLTPSRGASAVAPMPEGVTFGTTLPGRPDFPRSPASPSIRDDSSRIIEGAFKTKSAAGMSDDELIEQVHAITPQNATRILDEVAMLAERRAEENKWEVVTRVLHALVRGEATADTNPDLRRAYTLTIRRVGKPSLIRGIAGLLPRRPELRDDLQEVLLRLGPDGAEALIDLLTTADLMTDRRAYLAALAKCRDAVPTLIHLLGDNRWYVVRNAADLLGEMRAPEAENALVDAATHREERVRRSVATALARLATPRSIQAAQTMLADAVPEVRVHAVQGLGSTKWPRVVSVLSRALDTEQDAEVQAVILAALGRQASAEAVARLTKAAEPEGRLFKRKPTALRVSAVQALAEANTPAALAALKRFTEDREREVRDAAVRALRPKPEG